MSETYKLKEVHVILKDGVTLVAEVHTVAGLKSLLADLSSAKFEVQGVLDKDLTGKGRPASDPISRLETKASLNPGTLEKAKVLAFKDNMPQFLKPSIFKNVTDALLVLLFSVETGLVKSKIDYESFKGLYEEQNIKSGSPLAMLLNNVKNGGYLDKRTYSDNRSLSLTAKGQSKAIEVLNELSK